MVTIEEFSRVVSQVYASSIRPENWAVALAEISRNLDASGCGLLTGCGTSRSVMTATIPPEAGRPYVEYYRTIDYVLNAVEHGPAGLIHGGQALVALKTHSEFEEEWLRPYDMTDGLFVRLNAGATPASFLVAAPKRDEPFDTTERVKFLSALLPHLQQALRAQRHIVQFGSAANDITAVIEAIRHGIVIVGPEGSVVHLNTAAARILQSADGLCIRSGGIEATRPSNNAELQSSLTRARSEEHCSSRSSNSFTCSLPSGERPYVIHVLPLTASAEDESAAKALVIIIDPEQEHEPPKMLIRRLFGLTNAEADVALRVMRGDGLKPISEDLALSIATIKTHLHHIFDKTDTHRQAELVRLLLAIVP